MSDDDKKEIKRLAAIVAEYDGWGVPLRVRSYDFEGSSPSRIYDAGELDEVGPEGIPGEYVLSDDMVIAEKRIADLTKKISDLRLDIANEIEAIFEFEVPDEIVDWLRIRDNKTLELPGVVIDQLDGST